MAGVNRVVVQGAVEGPVDEAVLRRVIAEAGAVPGHVHIKNGKANLLARLQGYNNAARLGPWVVLIDLNGDEECAPAARESWLPSPAPRMCFCVAVRQVEAWILADRERLAQFLGIAASRVPTDPEALAEPKRAVVDLARRSRRRDIREDMVPRPESGRTQGPAYVSRMMEFAMDSASGWRPDVAAMLSASLDRCMASIRRLAEAAGQPT
jgi:hypothetical protein